MLGMAMPSLGGNVTYVAHDQFFVQSEFTTKSPDLAVD